MNSGYLPQGGKPTIFLRSRDINLQRAVHRIDDFIPYFWGKDQFSVTKDIFGRGIRKVTTRFPGEVPVEKEKYEYLCEADILFEWRYLYDKRIKCGYSLSNGQITPAETLNIPMKVGYFDLEVETPPEIMARPRDPKWPIVSFQWSNSYTKDIVLFMLNTALPLGNPMPIPKGFTGCKRALQLPIKFHRKLHNREWDITVHPTIYLYEEEKPMIYDNTLWAAWQDFDAMGGYSSDLFDWPYWLKRAKGFNLDLRFLSPFNTVEVEPKPFRGRRKDLDQKKRGWRLSPRVKGVALIDFYKMYQKWSGGRQGAKLVVKGKDFAQTFDFHLVMEKECGFYYIDLGDKVKDSRNNHPMDWLEYCVGDAYALRILDKERGIVKYFDRLRRIVGVPLEMAIHNSKLIDTRVLRLSDRPLPTRVYEKGHRVKGAIVLLPRIGIHEHVVIIDEKSLYPMLIRVYNLSPETYVADP